MLCCFLCLLFAFCLFCILLLLHDSCFFAFLLCLCQLLFLFMLRCFLVLLCCLLCFFFSVSLLLFFCGFFSFVSMLREACAMHCFSSLSIAPRACVARTAVSGPSAITPKPTKPKPFQRFARGDRRQQQATFNFGVVVALLLSRRQGSSEARS